MACAWFCCEGFAGVPPEYNYHVGIAVEGAIDAAQDAAAIILTSTGSGA